MRMKTVDEIIAEIKVMLLERKEYRDFVEKLEKEK